MLQKDVYLEPANELNLIQDQPLNLIKPLHGLSESSDYWKRTFQNNVKEEFRMKSCIVDAACLYKHFHN